MDRTVRKRCAYAGAVAIICIAAAYTAKKLKKRREGFVSPQAVSIFNSSKPVFENAKGAPQYSAYRVAVPQADPVQFDDMKKLWKKGAFTPENIQKIL